MGKTSSLSSAEFFFFRFSVFVLFPRPSLLTSNLFPSSTIPDLIAASRSSNSLSSEESSSSVGGGEKDEKRTVALEEEVGVFFHATTRLAPSASSARAGASIRSLSLGWGRAVEEKRELR